MISETARLGGAETHTVPSFKVPEASTADDRPILLTAPQDWRKAGMRRHAYNPAFRRLRQEDLVETGSSLGYIGKLYLYFKTSISKIQ